MPGFKIDLPEAIKDINNETQKALNKPAEEVIKSLENIKNFLNKPEVKEKAKAYDLINYEQAINLYAKFYILAKSLGFNKIIKNKKRIGKEVETLKFIHDDKKTGDPELAKLIDIFIEKANILLGIRVTFCITCKEPQAAHLDDDLKDQISELVYAIGSKKENKDKGEDENNSFELFYIFDKKEKSSKPIDRRGAETGTGAGTGTGARARYGTRAEAGAEVRARYGTRAEAGAEARYGAKAGTRTGYRAGPKVGTGAETGDKAETYMRPSNKKNN